MATPFFALLTDFGYDFAVACIKAVILKGLPEAQVVDLDHHIEKFNVASAAFVLKNSYFYFPSGTIFLCIVDPGVGTEREPLFVQTPQYSFFGPNNGIFDLVLEHEQQCTVYRINEHAYLSYEAHTFHGRDIFAPAAVDSYKGNFTHFFPFDTQKLIHIQDVHNKITVLYVDSFGNIKTNTAVSNTLFHQKQLHCIIKGKKQVIPYVKTFQDVPCGSLLCYRGSNNTLEIAINQGSAAHYLCLHVGDTIDSVHTPELS
jgi:S-adenosyl-L-methionine hydrolase (adenosine-forming)